VKALTQDKTIDWNSGNDVAKKAVMMNDLAYHHHGHHVLAYLSVMSRNGNVKEA